MLCLGRNESSSTGSPIDIAIAMQIIIVGVERTSAKKRAVKTKISQSLAKMSWSD